MTIRTHVEASNHFGPKFEVRVYNQLLADSRFTRVRKANLTEQKVGHFDIYAEAVIGGRAVTLRIECKSIKDNRDDLLLVEGRTVCDQNGETHNGWLFGQATHLACERADGSITWVPMSTLRKYVDDRGIDWWATPQTKKEVGKLYTRVRGRDGDPMISETVISVGLKIVTETRGDRTVTFLMSLIEKLAGVYTS